MRSDSGSLAAGLPGCAMCRFHSSIYRIPASQRKDIHWIVEPASCAVTGIDQCQLKVGERLAIIGCGFMGLMMLQMLVGMGCEQLVALDVDDQRLALAKQMGADEAYNASKEGFADIREDLKARYIDVVVDTSGAQEGLDLAGDLARRGGRINLFGWIKGERAYFNPSLWHTRGLTIVNSAPAARLRSIQFCWHRSRALLVPTTRPCAVATYAGPWAAGWQSSTDQTPRI